MILQRHIVSGVPKGKKGSEFLSAYRDDVRRPPTLPGAPGCTGGHLGY